MRAVLIVSVLLAASLAGCTAPVPEGFSWEDTDLDGIPDDIEEHLATDCSVFGRRCIDAGLQPPTVGQRDLIIVEISRSGEGENWRLSSEVWRVFNDEMAALNVSVQRTDLGLRDDLDAFAVTTVGATTRDFWDDFAWAHVLAYDEEQQEFYGENQGSWVVMADHESIESQTVTLLHEFYHVMLGPLDNPEYHSQCPSEIDGGAFHSNEPDSLLFVDAQCNGQDDLSLRSMTEAERAEFAVRPIDSLAWLNHPCWWQESEDDETTPCAAE